MKGEKEMSRSTQLIGLTDAAKRFVKDLKELESDSSASGMFHEKIPLRKWKAPKGGVVREYVQESPWSSGPMLFLCLDLDRQNESGKHLPNLMFEWIHDPTLEEGTEYDAKTGRMWV